MRSSTFAIGREIVHEIVVVYGEEAAYTALRDVAILYILRPDTAVPFHAPRETEVERAARRGIEALMLAARVGEFVAADAILRLAIFGFILRQADPHRADAMRRAEDRILAGLSASRELVQGMAMAVRPPSVVVH